MTNDKIIHSNAYHMKTCIEDLSEITNRKDKKGFTNPRDKWFKTEQFKNYIIEL